MPLAKPEPLKLAEIIKQVTAMGARVLFSAPSASYLSSNCSRCHCEISYLPGHGRSERAFWGNADTPRAAANIAFRQLEAWELNGCPHG